MVVRILAVVICVLSGTQVWPACRSDSAESLIRDVKSAWDTIDDYHTTVEVEEIKSGGGRGIRAFEYLFKKPDKIRIVMKSPDRGTILVYPDQTGRVAVKPGGLFGFLRPHFDPGSYLFTGSSGQRFDQTDLGLLIENISRSVGEERRGPVGFSENGPFVRIEVLATDHFRKGVVTRYTFMIDKSNCLPVEVVESTPAGERVRTITFGGIELNRNMPESLFTLEKVEE